MEPAQDNPSESRIKVSPPKPRSERYRPEITSLPELTLSRLFFRRVFKVFLRFLAWIFIDLKLTGVENIPNTGAAIFVSNHLGDADALLGWAYTPRIDTETILKSELYDFPVLGTLLKAYGVIWVHRGEPDRRTIRAVLEGIAEGRLVGIAPEGRESLIGGLEEGTDGAAYLALKSGAPLLPITFTGTENARVYNNMKHFRKTRVTIRVGETFTLEPAENRREAIKAGTHQIMLTLARQLPPDYWGVYAQELEMMNDNQQS